MRIVHIGDFGTQADEGMRKLSGLIHRGAAASGECLAVPSRDFCSLRALGQLRAFRPDCLHYITGPTVFSLLALRLNRLLLGGRVTTVATGLKPYLGGAARGMLRWYRPDWYLAQSRIWEQVFQRAGSRTEAFPNVVDCAKFRPVTPETKLALREKLGLRTDRQLVLHVGHVRENRNLRCLLPLQASGRFQVLVVGSPTQSEKGALHADLMAAGCWVRTDFVADIAEFYQAADRYVFTVGALPAGRFPRNELEVGVIDFPLSVIEALACGLPVLSTRHDALDRFLGKENAVAWFDGTGEGCRREIEAMTPGDPASLRALAERFDLKRVLGQLDSFYAQLAATREGCR